MGAVSQTVARYNQNSRCFILLSRCPAPSLQRSIRHGGEVTTLRLLLESPQQNWCVLACVSNADTTDMQCARGTGMCRAHAAVLRSELFPGVAKARPMTERKAQHTAHPFSVHCVSPGHVGLANLHIPFLSMWAYFFLASLFFNIFSLPPNCGRCFPDLMTS